MRHFICLIACSSLLTSASEPWSRFRGPDGSGVGEATGLPVKWTEADFKWRVKLPGFGHSSPAVWGETIFVFCGDRETGKRHLQALRATDGSVLWTKDFDSPTQTIHKLNSYGTATPAVDAERVYLTWTTPKTIVLLALDHAGKEVWRREDLGSFECVHGSGTSPIVVDNIVILANDSETTKSFIVGVDAKTGKTVWTHARNSKKASYSTPCLYRPQGEAPQVIFTNKDHGITALDPQTGKLIWEQDKVFPQRAVGSPTVADGLIVATCGEGGRGHVLAAVRPGTRAKPESAQVAYTLTKSLPYVPTPVAYKDLFFIWSEIGVVQCIRAAKGDVVWEQRVPGKYYASPICINGNLYNLSEQGHAIVLRAADKYELVSTNPIGEGSYATPALVGDRMIIRTFNHLVAVGGK